MVLQYFLCDRVCQYKNKILYFCKNFSSQTEISARHPILKELILSKFTNFQCFFL